jgi:protein O-mannosyl-transferase
MTSRTRVLILSLCTAVTYWNGLPAPFILDDSISILTNRSIETLTLPGPLKTPSDTPVARRPLVNLSFAVNYAFAQHDPRSYRVGNLLIHVLAALALFGVVRRTLVVLPADAFPRATAASVAWVCALLWALHPLNSEIVDYVTQRSSGMLGLFYLLTIYCAIRSATDRRGAMWVAAAVVCCAAGVLCKESMITAPVMVILYDRIFLFDSWNTLVSRRARLYSGLAASWLLLAVMVGSADRTSAGFGATLASGTIVSSWDYFLNQAQMIPRYLYLSVWPRALVVDYGITGTIPLSSVAVPALLLALGVTLVVVGLIRWPRIAFLGAWFFITLSPTSSVVPIATEVGAERRMYLPLAGLVVLVVIGVSLLARRTRVAGAPLRVVCAMTIVCLALGTMLRNRDYRDPVRLAQTVVERWPSGRAHAHLGMLYDERGRHDAALREYRKAAVLYPPGHYVLGVALVENRHVDEGMAHLEAFVSLAPRHPAVTGARDLIGRVLVDRGDLAGASRQFELTIAAHPLDARAIVLLAEVRMRQQRLSEAIALFDRARRLDASVARDAAMMRRFGTALAVLNRVEDAERVFAEAALANPGDVGLQKLWGRSLAAGGRFAAAAEHFRQAQRLAPDDAEARGLTEAITRRLGSARR